MKSFKRLFEYLAAYRYTVAILLTFHFVLCVLVYFNTTRFREISESDALLDMLKRILAGERPLPIFGFYWYYTPSYIGYFFIKVFGSLHAYFIFQCFLGTVTTFIIYRIVLLISNSMKFGIISIILMTIYVEVILLSSVFYNQIYEVFFGSLFLLLCLKLFRERKKLQIVLFSLTVILAVYSSLLFRTTLLYAFAYLFLISILFINRKDNYVFFKFFPLAIILFLLTFIFKPIDYLREGNTRPQGMAFWGHTLYGGHGGEADFIYQKNKDLYDKKLKEYAYKSKVDSITSDVIKNFQSYEVRRFITKEPHKWILLQFKKFFYTFGAVPPRDDIQMITTGKFKLPWWVASAIVQLPMVFLVLIFLLTMDFNYLSLIRDKNEKILVYLLGAYLIFGICFFATYQERYRPIVFVAAIIPIIAINIRNLKILLIKENRNRLYIRLSLISVFILIWIYQAYEAIVIDADRYFGALDKAI